MEDNEGDLAPDADGVEPNNEPVNDKEAEVALNVYYTQLYKEFTRIEPRPDAVVNHPINEGRPDALPGFE